LKLGVSDTSINYDAVSFLWLLFKILTRSHFLAHITKEGVQHRTLFYLSCYFVTWQGTL